MRVVAGRWRGRRLQAPAGATVRPTTDRTKEALFSILGPLVEGAVVTLASATFVRFLSSLPNPEEVEPDTSAGPTEPFIPS